MLKIFETSSDSGDESFADKLKQLDKLGYESASKQDTSSKQSDEQSKSKTLTGLNQIVTKIRLHLAGAVVQLEVMMR